MTIYYTVCAHRPAPNPVMADLTQFYTPCLECPGGVDGAKAWEYGPSGELTHPQMGGPFEAESARIGSDPHALPSYDTDRIEKMSPEAVDRAKKLRHERRKAETDPAAITARIHDEDE